MSFTKINTLDLECMEKPLFFPFMSERNAVHLGDKENKENVSAKILILVQSRTMTTIPTEKKNTSS